MENAIYLNTLKTALMRKQQIDTSVMWPKAVFWKILIKKKSRSQLSPHFPEKPFQAPKIIFKSPMLIGTFWKTKDWSSHFWEGQPFRFWYVEFHCLRRLKSTKSGYFSLILDLDPPRNQKFGLFSTGNSLNKEIL